MQIHDFLGSNGGRCQFVVNIKSAPDITLFSENFGH